MRKRISLALVLLLALSLAVPALAQAGPNQGASDAFKTIAHNQLTPNKGHQKGDGIVEYTYRSMVGSTDKPAAPAPAPVPRYLCEYIVRTSQGNAFVSLIVRPGSGAPIGLGSYAAYFEAQFTNNNNYDADAMHISTGIDFDLSSLYFKSSFQCDNAPIDCVLTVEYDVTITDADGVVTRFFLPRTDY